MKREGFLFKYSTFQYAKNEVRELWLLYISKVDSYAKVERSNWEVSMENFYIAEGNYDLNQVSESRSKRYFIVLSSFPNKKTLLNEVSSNQSNTQRTEKTIFAEYL